MSTFSLYMLLKMDALKDFIGVLAFLNVVVAIGFLISLGPASDHADKFAVAVRRVRLFVPLFCGFALLGMAASWMLPSTKEMAALYVVPEIVNNEEVRRLPQRVLTLAGEWIEELRPAKLSEGAKTIVQQPQAATGQETGE